jgi:hypothetical protein
LLRCVVGTAPASTLPALLHAHPTLPNPTPFPPSVQVKAYDNPPSLAGALRPRRLLVWEGRRKGCAGVGWGTGSLIREGVGAGIRDRARRKAESEAAAEAAKPAVARKPAAATASSEPAGGGKEADDESVRVCVSVWGAQGAVCSCVCVWTVLVCCLPVCLPACVVCVRAAVTAALMQQLGLHPRLLWLRPHPHSLLQQPCTAPVGPLSSVWFRPCGVLVLPCR